MMAGCCSNCWKNRSKVSGWRSSYGGILILGWSEERAVTLRKMIYDRLHYRDVKVSNSLSVLQCCQSVPPQHCSTSCHFNHPRNDRCVCVCVDGKQSSAHVRQMFPLQLGSQLCRSPPGRAFQIKHEALSPTFFLPQRATAERDTTLANKAHNYPEIEDK